MALIDSIVAYWKLDEESGNRADEVGSNTLVDVNTVLYAAGKIGNAATFVKANDEYFSLADNADMSIGSNDFSFNIWVKPLNATTQAGILGKYENSTNADEYYIVRTGDDKVVFTTYQGSGSRTSHVSTGTLNEDVWTMLTCTYATSDLNSRIYLNGSLDSSATQGTQPADRTAIFRLGSEIYQIASGDWEGELDECGFWKKELTADEVAELWNAGDGLTYPFTATSLQKVAAEQGGFMMGLLG
jgi:hypothetical protein